jgi:SagB-type dehydrogenase family enzyme
VCYWRGDALLIENYATGDVAAASPLVCALLDACADWQRPSALATALGTTLPRLKRLLALLSRRHLIQRSDRAADPREQAMAALDRWNPAAGFFHTVSRQVRFIAPRIGERRLRQQARHWPMPTPVKRLRSAQSIRLPAPTLKGEFPEILLRRRTWRRFSSRQISADQLGTALALAAGVQHWVKTATGDVPLKTSPSGGARHPIECYVAVRRVAGIAQGLYHYASDVHRLERVRRGDMTRRLRIWMPHSEYFAKAAFLVVFTAVFERQLWRYPYARAYRAAIIEAGHACQTFCLTATWLGLAPFCLMALADHEIERDLGIDGVGESVLYAAGAGAPPRGIAWAPLPRGTLKIRPNPTFRP